jgi:hypothetical protein
MSIIPLRAVDDLRGQGRMTWIKAERGWHRRSG